MDLKKTVEALKSLIAVFNDWTPKPEVLFGLVVIFAIIVATKM